MEIHQIIESKLNGLKILAEHGAEHVSPALSGWLGIDMDLKIFDVQVTPLGEVVSKVRYENEKVIGVLSKLEGGIKGNLLFIFSCDSGLSIVNTLFKKNKISAKNKWDSLAISAMEETANIIGSSFTNGLASFLETSILCKSPHFTIDYASSIIEFMLIEDAIAGDFALFFQTEFVNRKNKIDGQILLIPSPDSVKALLKNISP